MGVEAGSGEIASRHGLVQLAGANSSRSIGAGVVGAIGAGLDATPDFRGPRPIPAGDGSRTAAARELEDPAAGGTGGAGARAAVRGVAGSHSRPGPRADGPRRSFRRPVVFRVAAARSVLQLFGGARARRGGVPPPVDCRHTGVQNYARAWRLQPEEYPGSQ